MKNALSLTRAQFTAQAKEILLSDIAKACVGKPRKNATGSVGWNCNGKGVVPFGDSLLNVQIGANVTVIGSKNYTAEQYAAFESAAKELILGNISGAVKGAPRTFESGSLGWYCTGKGVVPVGDALVNVQIGCNVTVIGSKELGQ